MSPLFKTRIDKAKSTITIIEPGFNLRFKKHLSQKLIGYRIREFVALWVIGIE